MNLDSSVEELPLVGPSYSRRLEKLGIKNISDLLHHIPHRYLDFSVTSPISRAQPGETLTISAEVVSLKNQYTRSGKKMQIGEVADRSGKITVVWFNQPFLIRVLYPGVKVSLAGKVDFFGRKKALVSPEYEIVREKKDIIHTSGLVPIYPETSGLSSKWLRGRVKEALARVEEFEDFIPEELLKQEKLLPLREAVHSVHFPSSQEEVEEGRRRLAFDELILLHLASLKRKKEWQKNEASLKLSVKGNEVEEFIKALPFKLTSSQGDAIDAILSDLGKETPMNRLLEGDVGSGKTVVAAVAAFVSFINGCQSVFMAPTQILAQQHYQTLKDLFEPFKIRVALITSGLVKKDLGRTDIFVGTHSLIHKKVDFKDSKVALVVIDEQHRFGVEQREHLVRKTKKGKQSPHILTMTATPIPRTVALTFYGDLELSTLTQMPAGRQRITTWVIPPVKREKALTWMGKQIAQTGSQAFVICPLIEESEKETMEQVAAAAKEFKELKKVFKSFSLGLLHGRQTPAEKEKTMALFKSGKIDILVSTPVVEVGIDVANAAIMLIEGAERFGLAQLHQLRGRVGRGEKKSYCLLLANSTSGKVLTRLKALERGISGFELAELDLNLRGPGEIFGLRQHGFPELKIASWQDVSLIAKTKEIANQWADRFVLAHKSSIV